MTTYTIELPDRCPKCNRSITSLAPGGGHYAQLLVGGYSGGPIPHRCPLVIIAGTEAEKVTVFEVACIECVSKENHKLAEICEKGQAMLNLAEELIDERREIEKEAAEDAARENRKRRKDHPKARRVVDR